MRYGEEVERSIVAQFNAAGIKARLTPELDTVGCDVAMLQGSEESPVQVKAFVFEKDKKEGYTGHGAVMHLLRGVLKGKVIPCIVMGEISIVDMKSVKDQLVADGIWICPNIVRSFARCGRAEELNRVRMVYKRAWNWRPVFDVEELVD